MSKQRYINTKIWEDAWFSSLDQIEQLVFIYFLTNPMTNIIGVYELSKGTIGRAVGLETLMLDEILKRFDKSGKVRYCNGWVIITNFIKHQNYRSPMIKKAIEDELKQVPIEIRDTICIPYIDGIDTPSHLIKSNLIKSNIIKRDDVVSKKLDFNLFWDIYPNKTNKKVSEVKWSSLTKEIQETILKDIPERIKTDKWKKGFIENPTTYINQERWNDERKISKVDEDKESIKINS